MTKQFNWLLNQYIPNSKCNTPVISRNNAPWWMDLLTQQVSGLRTAEIPTILIQSRNNYCHPSSILALLAAGSISPIIPAIMGLPMAPIIGLLIIGLPIIPRPKAQNLKDQRRVLIKVSGWYVVSIHLHNLDNLIHHLHEEYESARQSGNWGSPWIWQQAVSSHNLLRSYVHFGLRPPHQLL